MDERLEALFTPWSIGGCEVKNRIVMTSMGGTNIFGWMEKNHFDQAGAEFLLARTEIDPEPFKEEVWWAQGAEWADKNGADIINSSLGYGKDRHWTRDMDGTSYVAKAANKAVEKGILICNSAGNEGSDSRWMTIITPADAENVLCVGGINASLEYYQHISFSSYGPTADKRRKPDVVAFGHAKVANPSGGFTEADGTSFASPLTAGFCACEAYFPIISLNALAASPSQLSEIVDESVFSLVLSPSYSDRREDNLDACCDIPS